MLRLRTYGFTGSLKVSRKSSILLVCSLIASNGLGSFKESLLLDVPKVFCPPRLYPAVPRICAIVAVLLEVHQDPLPEYVNCEVSV